MSRNEQMIRFLKMITALERVPDGFTLSELAKHFDVHVKTIRRDLAAMKTASINIIEEDRVGEKVYRIVDDDGKIATSHMCGSDITTDSQGCAVQIVGSAPL